MNKIQTWFSDLSDWFYNFKNLNLIAFTVNLIDEAQDDMIDDLEVVPDQIKELYKRVRVLEIAETNRQFEAMVAATGKSLKKAPKKAKKVTKRQ